MQRDRQPRSSLLDVDVFGRRVPLDQLVQMVEQRFRHQMGDIVADPFAGDEKIWHRGRRDICGLAVIGKRRSHGVINRAGAARKDRNQSLGALAGLNQSQDDGQCD